MKKNKSVDPRDGRPLLKILLKILFRVNRVKINPRGFINYFSVQKIIYLAGTSGGCSIKTSEALLVSWALNIFTRILDTRTSFFQIYRGFQFTLGTFPMVRHKQGVSFQATTSLGIFTKKAFNCTRMVTKGVYREA